MVNNRHRVITVAHTKGGPGKTTLALQLAFGLAYAGHAVWLVDGDDQQTALKAASNRDEPIPAAGYPDGNTLKAQIRAQAARYDYTVIDTGGRASTALRAALLVADVLLVPFKPAAFELWAHDEVIAEIDAANEYREAPIDARAVINCADPVRTSPDNTDCRAQILETGRYRLLETQIVDRKAIGRASALGLYVGEYKPRDAEAASEIDALINELTTGITS